MPENRNDINPNNGYNPEGMEASSENVPVNNTSNAGSNLVHMGQNANAARSMAQGFNKNKTNEAGDNNLAKGINNKNNQEGKNPSNNNLPGQNNNQNKPNDDSNKLNNNDNKLQPSDDKKLQGNKDANLPEDNSNLDKLGQKKDDNNSNKSNPATGIKPKEENKNNKPSVKDKMPGVRGKEEPKKKPEKGNMINKKGDNKNRFIPSPVSKALNKRKPKENKNKAGVGSIGEALEGGRESAGSFISNIGKNGIKAAFAALPPQAKVVVYVAIPIAAVFITLLFILALFLTTTVTTMTDICDSDSSVSGPGEVTAADTMDFLCKMQSPFGNKKYPVYGWVGEQRPGHIHSGVDLSLGCGTAIYSAQGGTVYSAGWENGYGNSVVLKHSDGKFYTRYGHMSKILVSKGATVSKGQKIGLVGNTGNSGGCHLHFEVREGAPYGTTVKAINDYFNASKATEHQWVNVSEKFKKQCGSSWQGDPTGASASDGGSASNNSGSGTDTSSSSLSSDCCVSTGSSSSSSGNYCSNGITVAGKTMSLEDYVAGVVTAENSYKNGNNIEASKAQAIAARTFAINHTSNCSKSIANSQSAQVYKTPGEIGKKAAEETSGQVMLNNGKVFSSQYDSFCGKSGTATYTRVPSSATHSITLSSKFTSMIAGGHCHGMSQLYARQLQDEGKKYDAILRFFYADGIEITGSSNTCSLGGDSFNGKIWVYYQYNYREPYGNGTIAQKGCGPTSMAMVVSSFLNKEVTPVTLANYSMQNGYYVSGQGTAWGFFKAVGNKYGLTVKQVSTSKSGEVLAALNSGNSLVIAAMGPGTFTTGGHFILLTGVKDGKVAIQDPASEPRSKKTWDFKDPIVSQAKQFWIISKG